MAVKAWGEDWTKAQELLALGLDIKRVAEMVGRSRDCLKNKIQWENQTEEQRQARCDQKNARRREIASRKSNDLNAASS